MKTFPVIRVIVGAGVIVVALAVANLRSSRTADHAIPVVRADSDTDSGCTLASLKGSYAVSRQGTLLTSIRHEDVRRIRDYRTAVGGAEYRILRGAIHRHTDISNDGAGDGSLEDFYRYMLDAAAMDTGIVTDHNMDLFDHLGQDMDHSCREHKQANFASHGDGMAMAHQKAQIASGCRRTSPCVS